MRISARVINVILNKVESRSRFDALRTLLSRFELFLPVSKKRWLIAQDFESIHYQGVINNVPVNDSAQLLRHYSGPGPQYFRENIEEALGVNLKDFLLDKVLIEIACGASSVFLNMETTAIKLGVDPMSFSDWVISRYSDVGATIISKGAEDFDLSDLSKNLRDQIKAPLNQKVVLFTNALQHFQSPKEFFFNLQNQIGGHDLIFLEFLDVPADRAHPQILTKRRLDSFLSKFDYMILGSHPLEGRLPGYIEAGEGQAISMYVVHARRE